MKQLLTLTIVALCFFSSCDRCLRVECINGGECETGRCLCADGKEHPVCDDDFCLHAEGCPDGIPCRKGVCVCPDSLFGTLCEWPYPTGVEGDYTGEGSCENFFAETWIDVNITATNDPLVFEVEDWVNGIYLIEFVSNVHFTIPEHEINDFWGVRTCYGEGDFRNGEFDMTLTCEQGILSEPETCTRVMN